MTKAELLRALWQYPDDATILVWCQGEGEREVQSVGYHGGKPVFVHLIARRAEPQGEDRGSHG